MKKLIALIVFVVAAFAVNAQSTTPRFGTAKNQDNTGRVLTYAYQTATDTQGADSLLLNPNAWKTTVRITMLDSFCMKNPVVTRSYAGDNIVIIASGANGTKLKFSGANYLTSGTATLSSVGRAVISLVFDGAKWVEVSRTVQ